MEGHGARNASIFIFIQKPPTTRRKCYNPRMMNSTEKNLLISQIQTDVSLISILSVISVFFIGALLPQFNSYDLSVKIPISFLIIATFAFLFAALILSNAIQKIREGRSEEVGKYLSCGYAISEYMGVFLFVVSVPIAINIVTEDLYLRIITFCAAILGLAIYEFMGFSLIKDNFSSSHKIFSLLFIIFGIVLFASQIYAYYFTLIAVFFLLFILFVTILAPIKDFQ
jgi:hypothetical protein